MDVYGCLWFSGYLWVFFDVYEFLGVCECMGAYGQARLTSYASNAFDVNRQ